MENKADEQKRLKETTALQYVLSLSEFKPFGRVFEGMFLGKLDWQRYLCIIDLPGAGRGGGWHWL